MTKKDADAIGQTIFRYKIPLRYRIQWFFEELWVKMPWMPNEGEATARVVDMAFGGYPMEEDFATKEEAVALLQAIWDIVDNWDGSRINVEWAAGRKEGSSVYEWARESVIEWNEDASA